jgi:hypothetical protein
LDTENIRCRERRVVIPQNLQNIILKVSGEQEPGFSLELERRSAGNEHIDRLKIDKLAGDEAIKPGRYYFLARGEFPVPGPFAAGEIIYLNIVNAASFGGQLKLELIGKKGRFNYAAVPPHKQE